MLRVADLMTENVLSVSSDVSVAKAIALMQLEKVRSLIVISADQSSIHGILTERDIVYQVIAPGLEPGSLQVSDIMRSPCISVHPEATVQEVATLFANTGIQRAPVIDSEKLLGVISATDLIVKCDAKLRRPADILSRRIQSALLHSRISSNLEDQVASETQIAWKIREEMDAQVT